MWHQTNKLNSAKEDLRPTTPKNHSDHGLTLVCVCACACACALHVILENLVGCDLIGATLQGAAMLAFYFPAATSWFAR